MKKYILTVLVAVLLAFTAPVSHSLTKPFTYAQVQAADSFDGMKRLNLVIKKLRDAMGSMKDFDELEKAGLRKKDVDRMRHAMQKKIEQMMEDAIYAIRSI